MRWRLLVGFLLVNWLAVAVAADRQTLPLVSPMFGDNMVLQRGKPNVIWGWSKPGTKVIVAIAGSNESALTDASGRWQVKIQPPPSGGPYTITITGAEQQLTLREVLVGDVWLCGGQSNMEFGLGQSQNGAEELKKAEHPEIRLFTVKNQVAYAPAEMPQGTWKICSPQTISGDGGNSFSAVAYFFGRRLQEDLHVPIGLVQDCIGGTPAESWTSAAGLRPLSDFDASLAEVERLRAKGGPQYGSFIAHWYDEFDLGQTNNAWFAAGLDDRDWSAVTISGAFRELGVPETPAVVYFRKKIVLPNPLPAGAAKIFLGSIERMDTTQINGRWVGASAWVENPRVYHIADGVLEPGTNVIAIRVFKTKTDGGFKAQPSELRLVLGDKTEINLGGEWKGKVSVDARPPHPLPAAFENWPTMPAVLFNGMIAPVAPLAITGVIWYQGEANVGRAAQYRKLLPQMIADWRTAFGQGEIPFYIVSLAAFMAHKDVPGEDAWAELREAQDYVASTVKNSGLVLAIDVGDAQDIHPKNKQPVGERLALLALAKHYDKSLVHAGPHFVSAEKCHGGLKLNFSDTAAGLVAKGGSLEEFSVAGTDGVWHWANAKIDGAGVVVTSPAVPEPVAARYAWQANPRATLYNSDGFPAVPFRTDVPWSK